VVLALLVATLWIGWLMRVFRVRVVDNLSSGRLANIKRHVDSSAIELVVGDLKDPEVALRVINGVDTVIHYAATGG